MLNIFNNTGNPIVAKAVEEPKTSEQVSVDSENIRVKWYESPLMFIGVITGLLLVIHFVERKVV